MPARAEMIATPVHPFNPSVARTRAGTPGGHDTRKSLPSLSHSKQRPRPDLQANGANPWIRDSLGRTPLERAERSQRVNVVVFLRKVEATASSPLQQFADGRRADGWSGAEQTFALVCLTF